MVPKELGIDTINSNEVLHIFQKYLNAELSSHIPPGAFVKIITYGGLHDTTDVAPTSLHDRLEIGESLLRLLDNPALNDLHGRRDEWDAT